METTTIDKIEKRNWFLFMVGYFTAGYLAVNWISSNRAHFFNIAMPLDYSIPFIPFFIFGYILVYASVLLVYIVIKNTADWQRTIVAFLLATTIAYIIFLVFPIHMSLRPVLAGLTGVSAEVTKLYHIIDLPYNCFPSLHVTYPTLAMLIAWRNHKTARWVFAAMTLIVAVSVVLVKQHYIADVLAGFLNAAFCYWLAVKSEKIWGRWFKQGWIPDRSTRG